MELCKGILFADDTTIYNSHQNLRYLKWTLEHNLDILNDWFKANQLCLNNKKSVGMIFSYSKNLNIECIVTAELSLQVVDHTKFLGVWIDDKLKWRTHVDRVPHKILRNLNLLKLSNNPLNIHAKRLIYFAQIQSHINYCLST